MKKMVCEICDSQKIKKENGVFVCQDCGSEYTLEEARALLQEVDEVEILEDYSYGISNNNHRIVKNNDNKEVLLTNLMSWLKLVMSFENVNFWLCKSDYVLKYVSEETGFNYLKSDILESRKKSFSPINGPTLMKMIAPEDGKSGEEGHARRENNMKILGDSYRMFFNIIKSPWNIIRENPIIKSGNSYMHYHQHEMVLYRGNKYYKYFIYFNDDYSKGIPLEKVAFNERMWWDLLVTRNSKKISLKKTEIVKLFFSETTSQVDVKDEMDINKFLTAFDRELVVMIRQYNAIIKFYDENYDEMIENYRNVLKSVEEMEKQFFIPHKFRKQETLLTLITYIKDGRVDNWKEALNLLETEAFQKAALESLNNINSKLSTVESYVSQISYQLSQLNSKLTDLNSNISMLRSTLSTTNYNVTKILNTTRANFLANL